MILHENIELVVTGFLFGFGFAVAQSLWALVVVVGLVQRRKHG